MSTLQAQTSAPESHVDAATASIDQRCMSYYLGLRYLPYPGMQWCPGVGPSLVSTRHDQMAVSSSDDILDALAESVPKETGVGLLLSGGIDSAILAALVPPETPCYTIAFDAPGAVDESKEAAQFAEYWRHPHQTIRIKWDDYASTMDVLFAAKAAPLHAIEVPLHLAAAHAEREGITSLIVGNGADSTFGGMDRLLSVDWAFDDFVERYRFSDPKALLTEAADLGPAFEPYRTSAGIDVQRFLREVHGQGIVQAFDNAIGSAGVDVVAPYEDLIHDGPLDMVRIRAGEPKYLLQEAFRLLYDTDQVPAKVPFARPMDTWLKAWAGPADRPEFHRDVAAVLTGAPGETRWLVWCLEAFCRYLDGLPAVQGNQSD